MGHDGPSPELLPEQVVGLVLQSCLVSASAAAETLWAFAAERLRRHAGTPDDLARLLANELFGPLISSREVAHERVERLDRSARQVIVVRAGDERVAYLFALSQVGGGELAGCWLVSGLERA